MNFTLFDCNSINLNFLIYINNLYKNFYKHPEVDSFPWIYLKDADLLCSDEFNIKAKDIWNNAIYLITDNLIDSEIWETDPYNFKSLFNNADIYEYIKRAYNAWFFNSWQLITSLYGRIVINKYYNNILNYVKKNDLYLKNESINLKFVYDKPPLSWDLQNKQSIVVYPEILLTAENDIFKRVLKLCTMIH